MQPASYPAQPGVPGQTVYVHQTAAPVNYATTVQNPNSTRGVSENFNAAAGRATGWLQLFIGIGSIVVAIAEIVLITGVGFSGMGIWASVLFYIPTGILGICSYQKNTCVVIAYLTMCIISAVVAFFQMVAGSIGAGAMSGVSCYIYDDCGGSYWAGRIASDALLAVLGVIEMVAAIVASAYCCSGVACGNTSPTTTTTTTMYTQQAAPMVVTTGQYPQYPQPAGTAQQPPAYNAQQAYPQAGQPAPQPGYNQAGYNQATPAPYNQQAAAGPTKFGGMVA